ncbi:DUF2147 domain-containing protein [Sphingomonas lutea]|nr:DUF2147 domain-containing protein [Sphingomonas lutea]
MVVAYLFALAAQAAAPGIEGRWANPKRSVVMVIAPCGAQLCGTVEEASDKAKADARKGTAQLVGSQLLTEVRPVASGRWQGKLFVPDKRMRVTAKLQLTDAGQLKVSGCALGKSLCKTQVWTRQ